MNQMMQLQKPRETKNKIQVIKLESKNQVPRTPEARKAIIFDSGTLISFSMNGLLDLIKKLKDVFNGKFLITQEVKKEVIDNPIKNKKFELEAMRIKELLDEKVIELPEALGVDSKEVSNRIIKIMALANGLFRASDRFGERDIHLLDLGESSCLALSSILTEKKIKNAIAIDERTTRMLAENQENLRFFLERKLHVKIKINEQNTYFFQNFKIIRSTELAYVAYKKGLIEMKNGTSVLDAILYALKFKGAAISGEEIEEIKRMK